MPERDLQRLVMQLLRLCQWESYHTWRSVNSAPGFPDIIAARGGRLLAIELKSATGKLSPAQEHWLAVLGAAGCECHVFRPEQWCDGTIERALR